MPKNTAVMRAPTTRERIMDFIGGIGESVSEQPILRLLSKLDEDSKRRINPDNLPMAMGDVPVSVGGAPAGQMSDSMRNFVRNMYHGEKPALSWEQAIKRNAGGNDFGKALAPEVQKMHPAVPAEFHAVEKARIPQSRTAPIDMENLPSGKIEYLDPDVAEYMNPKGLDVTTREGQRRLRFLTGK